MIFQNLRDASGYAAFFLSYRLLRVEFDKFVPETMSSFICGGLAGAALWTAGMPFDVVKSRYQTDTAGKYKSLKHVVTHTYANGGIKSFYKGYVPTIIRSFPANAVCFCMYEVTMTYLNKLST